jgi:RimJ/RimL family protein N-acetyltransferase
LRNGLRLGQSTVPPNLSLPPEIRTPRLVLRRQGPHDAPLIKDAVDTSLAHLQASVAWAQGAPEPLPVLKARLAASAAAFNAGEDWTFSILDRTSRRVLGRAAPHRADAALSALVGTGALETGYWLRADAVGHGYATEATVWILDASAVRGSGAGWPSGDRGDGRG